MNHHALRVSGMILVLLATIGSPIRGDASQQGEAAVAGTTLYNHTLTVSDARCRQLFVVAYDSLGFTAPQAIRQGDFLFCGRHYLAWIDNTGFYGEMNALWQLNGKETDGLDFVYGPDGLVRNMLVAAENRDGRWPQRYSGSVHVEVLSHTPEVGDACIMYPDESCNAFGINEAGSFDFALLPTWGSCNQGSPSFQQLFVPSIHNSGSGALRKLVYEAPLTKEADFDRTYDCEDAHADWLFPGPGSVRGRVYLQIGWELFGTLPFFKQTFRVRNPAGNPQIGGEAYVIHGLVTTDLYNPPPGKEFRNWVQPLTAATSDGLECPPTRQFPANTYSYNGGFDICQSENVFAANDLWAVSSVNGAQRGRTFVFWHSFEDGGFDYDTHVCECHASRGLEIQGGTVGQMHAQLGNSLSEEHGFNVNLATYACANSGRLSLGGTEDDLGGSDLLNLNMAMEPPLGAASVEPSQTGARLLVRAANGAPLLDIPIPAGSYAGGRGWRRVSAPAGTISWIYHASSDVAVQGIISVSYTLRGNKFKLKVRGRKGFYRVPLARAPLRVQLRFLETPEARMVACGETTLANCAASSTGNGLLCRRARGDRQ